MAKKPALRLPVKSPTTGNTLALICQEGLVLYCKHTRTWEIHPLDEILHLHEEVMKMAENTSSQDKTA